jgi:hypothetical protein
MSGFPIWKRGSSAKPAAREALMSGRCLIGNECQRDLKIWPPIYGDRPWPDRHLIYFGLQANKKAPAEAGALRWSKRREEISTC